MVYVSLIQNKLQQRQIIDAAVYVSICSETDLNLQPSSYCHNIVIIVH